MTFNKIIKNKNHSHPEENITSVTESSQTKSASSGSDTKNLHKGDYGTSIKEIMKTEKGEFDLSKKRVLIPEAKGASKYWYQERDVKEFIRKLKEAVEVRDCDLLIPFDEIDKLTGGEDENLFT